jgi:hypothetical protein
MHDRTRVTAIKSHDDIRDLLREVGVPSRKAKAAAGVAWKAINETDETDDTGALHEIARLFETHTAKLGGKGVF